MIRDQSSSDPILVSPSWLRRDYRSVQVRDGSLRLHGLSLQLRNWVDQNTGQVRRQMSSAHYWRRAVPRYLFP